MYTVNPDHTALSEQYAILPTIGRIISVIDYGVPKFRVSIQREIITIMQLIYFSRSLKIVFMQCSSSMARDVYLEFHYCNSYVEPSRPQGLVPISILILLFLCNHV